MKRTTLLIVLILTLFPSLALTQDDDRVTIRFWHVWGNVTWLPEVVEPAFEAAFPQYDLELRVLDGYNNAYDLYTLAQEQGDPPELLQGTSSNTQAPRDSGFFKPLHEAIAGRTEINGLPVRLDEIVGPAATFYQLDNEFYEVPWNASTPILFANMDLLVEAGLAEDVDDIDAIPATWAEVTEACAVIVENLDDVDCILFGAGGWYFENALAMQGAFSANNENGRGGGCVTEVVFNNDAGVAYQNWNNSLEDAGYWVDYGRSEYNITWANSQLALHMTSSAAARGRVEIGEGNGFTVGAGRMPYNQDVPYVGNTVGGGMILLTDGLEPEVEEGALTFLMFLLEPENVAAWHKSTGYVPITQSGFDFLEAEGWFEENPTFAVANHQLSNSARVPQTAGAIYGSFSQVYRMFREVFQNIIRNDADAQESLDRLKAEADLLIAEYNLLVPCEE
jgi:sn-glycerol 3-phosphate transport system substrate-binding protein